MKKEQFYKLLENPSQANTTAIKSLEKVIANNPYFTTGRLLHPKIQIERKNIKASEELEKRGTYYPNELILEDWAANFEDSGTEQAAKDPSVKESVDVSKELMDVLPTVVKDLTSPVVKPEKNEEKSAPVKPIEEKLEEEKTEEAKSEEPKEKLVSQEEVKEQAEPETPSVEKEETTKSEEPSEDSNTGDIADEVMKNMLALRQTLKDLKPKEEKKPAAKPKGTTKAKTTAKKSATPKKKTTPKATPKKKTESQKKTIAGNKEREKKLESQQKLIKNFIKNPPDLKPEYKGEDKPNEDLSTVSTSENRLLVSESLAKILSRQGKHQKAIEVYEQLMLKYPKKKSYFAAQIKNLKK